MADGPGISPDIQEAIITPKSSEAAKPSVEIAMRMGGKLKINKLQHVGSNFTEDKKSRDFVGKDLSLSNLTETDRQTISELPIGTQNPYAKLEANVVVNMIAEHDSYGFITKTKERLELDINPTNEEPKIDLSKIHGLQNVEEPDPKDPGGNKRLKVTTFTLNSPVQIAGRNIESVRWAVPALELTEFTQQKEMEGPQIEIKDLIFMHNNSLGLRHVESLARAQKEKANGIISGDALAIGSAQSLLGESSLPLVVQLQNMNQESRADLLLRYERSIRNFVQDSVGRDLNIVYSDGDTRTSLVKKFLETGKGAFLLAKFQGASNGYEQEHYYGLGKVGQENASGDDIKGVMGLKETDVDFSSLKKESVGEEAWINARGVLSNAFYKKLVDQVRSLQEIPPSQASASEAVEALAYIPSSEIEMSGGGKIKIASIKSVESRYYSPSSKEFRDQPSSSLLMEADRKVISDLPFWIAHAEEKPNEEKKAESPAEVDMIINDRSDLETGVLNSMLELDFREDKGLRFEPDKMRNSHVSIENERSVISFEPESELKINGKNIKMVKISVPPMAELAKVPEPEVVKNPVAPIPAAPRRRKMEMA